METKSVLDDMGGLDLTGEMVRYFGGKRATELIGWALLFGLSGFKTGGEMRAYLEAKGLSKSAMYRALADLKKFADDLDAEQGVKTAGQEVARKIARLVTVPI
jgi:hypothetical protein